MKKGNLGKRREVIRSYSELNFKKSGLPTQNIFFTHPFVEKYIWPFLKNFSLKKSLLRKTLPALILIPYPQFVPNLFYTIFAASFQILEKIQYVNHSDYP